MTARPDTGVWRLDGVLTAERRADLLARLVHYENHPERYEAALEFERERGRGAVRKMRRLAWVDREPWSALWRNEPTRRLLSELFDEPVGVAYCAAFLKPPRIGSRTPYHQDQALWRRELPGAISCWVALDETTTENGCLVMRPGSHALGLLAHDEPPGGGHPEVRAELVGDLPFEPAPLSPGSAIAWGRFTVHGSAANASARPRRGVVSVFAPMRLLDPGDPEAT